jgi:hypothetical protein
MTYFVTLTVPSPRTDHSLRHSTTRVGLRARRVRILFFRENVRFGRFSWAVAHGFRHPGQFFGNLPDCHKILIIDILWGFDWFLDHRVHVPGLLRVISLPFPEENYLLKRKPEWHISSLERSLLHVPTIVQGIAPPGKVSGPDGFEFYFFRKHPFRAIFVSLYSTRFSAPEPIFWKPPGLSQNTCRWHFMRFRLIFGP